MEINQVLPDAERTALLSWSFTNTQTFANLLRLCNVAGKLEFELADLLCQHNHSLSEHLEAEGVTCTLTAHGVFGPNTQLQLLVSADGLQQDDDVVMPSAKPLELRLARQLRNSSWQQILTAQVHDCGLGLLP